MDDTERNEIEPDTSDPRYVQKQKKSAKAQENAEKEAIKLFMQTETGRKFFYNLLRMCRVYTNPFSQDPIQMAYNCGELNVGQQLLAKLENASPELYLQMVQEGNERNG